MTPRFEVPKIRQGGDLFGKGSASWHDAILHVYHPSWTVYVRGYRVAADRLVEHALAERSDRDFLIYPILFLYRQFLELALKEVIKYALMLSDETPAQPGNHHRLERLWNQVEELMPKVSDGSLEEHVAVIRNAVQQFESLDPTSQLFRYPEKNDGRPVQYPVERVNLPTLRAEMENAGTALEFVSGGLSALVDVRSDYRSETGP